MTRHARKMEGASGALCGDSAGRVTRPHETVNCPDCRVILNYVRRTYPEHADYTDWRSTTAQRKAAARDMAADMMGGAND